MKPAQSPRAFPASWGMPVFGVALGLAILALGGRSTALVMTEIFIMALFASSLNLIITYGGLVSFGHAAFFGLGAYGFTLAVTKLGVPPVPALVFGPLLAALGGALFGALCVRLNRIYFAMLTLACAQITYTVLFQWDSVTGGDNGITGFMAPRFGLDERVFGALVLAVLAAGLAIMWRIVHAPLGVAIRAVGLDAHRASALGLNPRREQLTVFVAAAALAGAAGACYSAFYANVFPDYADLGLTLDALVMVVIGGIGSFPAGVLGAIAYVMLKHYLPLITMHWQLIVGIAVAVVILFMPQGLSGGLERLRAFGRNRQGATP